MKFEEILPQLKKGMKAYRRKYAEPAWSFVNHYVYFEHEEVMRKYYNSSIPTKSYLEYEDIVADDWEILRNKTMKPITNTRIIEYTHITSKDYGGYEIIVDEKDTPPEPPYLYSQEVELCTDPMKCHILYVPENNIVCYYDSFKEKLFITYDDSENHYKLDKKMIQRITDYLRWNNYIIYNYHYDWEGSILCIEKEGD